MEGMATLADKSVDHVICDPPYEAEAHNLQRRTKDAKNGNAGGHDGRVAGVFAVSFEPITEAVRDAVCREAARVVRRWAIFFCQSEAVAAWRASLSVAGLGWKRAAIWVKPDAQPQLTGDKPGVGYESIAIAHPAGRSRWNGGGRVGVYVFNKNADDKQRFGHPTQKPLALMEQLVRDFTDPGELVCDPFAGSGTTGVACKRLGRNFIGWEKDPKFHAAAVKRIDAAREQFQLPRLPKAKQTGMVLHAPGAEAVNAILDLQEATK